MRAWGISSPLYAPADRNGTRPSKPGIEGSNPSGGANFSVVHKYASIIDSRGYYEKRATI